MAKYYFCGIAGSGMSALAQIKRMEGYDVAGSDRSFDKGVDKDLKERFIKLGIQIHPQDGSALNKDIDYFVYSTAIEPQNPEFVKAKELNLKMIHRSELLESYVKKYKTISVGGTSGKTTLTALIWHIFHSALKKPLLINGGFLLSLMEEGLIGNAYYDVGKYLVVEADESDKTIERYHPYIGIIHNIQRDHKEITQLKEIFLRYANNSKICYLNEDDENVYSLKDLIKNPRFYGTNSAKLKILDRSLLKTQFEAYGQIFELPLGGEHNISNALAAITVAYDEGITLKEIREALLRFKGTYRRFNIIGTIDDIIVIDDYAHNPHKISSTLTHCIDSSPSRRIILIYQPHGFTPTRMFKDELIKIFTKRLREGDILIMPEIYYAGGSVVKDISSKDITNEVSKSREAYFFLERKEIIDFVVENVKKGDMVIVMGARDPTLHSFAVELFKSINQKYDKIYRYER